jgi:hypothetical protein
MSELMPSPLNSLMMIFTTSVRTVSAATTVVNYCAAEKFPQLTDGDPKVFKVFAKLFAVDQGAMI